ncbi:MAG: tRNA lysidine(34) synthetase TilS, partial [Rhodanobacteraceae bacterium]
ASGTLTLQRSSPDHTTQLDPPLSLRFRRGGEHIKPVGDSHTRELRDLFQQANIPPWQREHIPLIYSQDELLAVGDYWFSEAGKASFERIGTQPVYGIYPEVTGFPLSRE